MQKLTPEEFNDLAQRLDNALPENLKGTFTVLVSNEFTKVDGPLSKTYGDYITYKIYLKK